MGGSSKQVTGYRYFANFLLFIGNPIEKLLGINFDKRGWITPDQYSTESTMLIDRPYLYGENEGGVFGDIDIHTGTSDQQPNAEYKKYFPLASGYPYQSYLVFRGSPNAAIWSPAYGQGFYLGNSGYMKEMLLWPKRTRIRNDGRRQWYEMREDEAIVCEINGYYVKNDEEFNPQSFTLNVTRTYTGGQDINEINFNKVTMNFSPNKSGGGYGESSQNYFEGYHEEKQAFVNTSIFDILVRVHSSVRGESTSIEKDYETWIISGETLIETAYCSNSIYNSESNSYVMGVSLDVYFIKIRQHRIFVEIEAPDINPVHKIREILTDDTAMNKPESDVNDANFMKAADRIWDEGLGISWAITEKSCIDAINELCSHIEAGIRVNRQTGLYEMVLFRDDWFEEDEIHSLAENKIKLISFEVQNADEVVNQLNVSYYDSKNIKNASFSISENASIKNMQGRVNAEASDFPYFMNQRNAAVVAQWKLKQFTSPCWKGTFTTGHNQARKWNRYDIVKLNWSRKGIADLPVRIMSINLGDGEDNTVSIDFVEVVPFSNELTSSVVIDDKIDVTPLPPQPILFKAFELSYFEAVQAHGQRTVDDELAFNPNSGYVAVVAQRSQNNSLNAQMHTDAGAGYENSAVIQYCETAQLDQSIDRLTSSFIVKKVGGLASVRIGSQIFINNEIMVFQGFDAESKLLTVKRGALDTIPKTHADDSVLFFADDFVAVDSTEYAEGEAIDVKALTTTPSGVLDLDDVNAQTVGIQSRAIRPYPPANVKINGEYWPTEIETDLILTWVNRNRTQQTGGEIIGWYEGGVTSEHGVTYQLILIERDESEIVLRTQNLSLGSLNTYTFAISAMDANTRTIEIILKSLRDGYESYSAFNHIVELSQFFSAPYDITYVVSDI